MMPNHTLLYIYRATNKLMGMATLKVVAMLICMAAIKPVALCAQDYNQIGPEGNITQANDNTNRNFNPHNTDSTKNGHKEIPRGIHSWTVDRKFGEIRPVLVDTMPHLYMNTIFNTGLHGEYNTTGNNYTARLNRIFIERGTGEQFVFTEPYSYVYTQPDEFHFTNTLSPITNLSYDECGDKTNGEDHLRGKFAVNVNKRLGMGFDLNYAYARGYFANQNTSHFGATFYASYLGDQYRVHLLFTNLHQKVSENGGITNDEYITHPESQLDSYSENEIPTVLQRNYNRNDNQHLFLTHRYSLGFYHKVKMTEDELKARQFAKKSKKANDEEKKKKKKRKGDGDDTDDTSARPSGRPDDARIVGLEPERKDTATVDTTRLTIESQAKLDSLVAATPTDAKAEEDSTMKREFVPVTSIIHTMELHNYRRTYLGYTTPSGLYADTFYQGGYDDIKGDTISDRTTCFQLKNTAALALLEGFNKYARAGLKAFITHELRRFQMPDSTGGYSYQERFTEHNVSVGGQLAKTQGKTLHYRVQAETWLAGKDIGQLKVDFDADLNFRLFGDTVSLAAKAYFYRLNPTFYQRQYHSKHIWWDADLSKETRTRIEAMLSYQKTKTKLRLAIEEMQNYTYLGMSYDYSTNGLSNYTANIMQHSGNINLLTLQLCQDVRWKAINWENIITWQNSSNTDVLPLPTLNLWTNLYLKFRIARVLSVELGADMIWFSKYYAPDYCPQLSQFAIQQNADSRVELGGFPFVNVYANMHLKRARFFVMMSNVANGAGNRMTFLAPHYPTNSSVLRLGVSWNFFN